MASSADILDALLARCTSLDIGSPALPVAYPEVHFYPETQAPDGKYLAVSVFFNRPAWEALAAGKIDQGLLQVTVVWPKQDGLVRPMEVADAVKAHFPKGLRLSSPSGQVRIAQEPWTTSPVVDADKLSIPVTIPWQA